MPEPNEKLRPLPRRNELVVVPTETDKFIDATNERMAVETAKLNKARENRHTTKKED